MVTQLSPPAASTLPPQPSVHAAAVAVCAGSTPKRRAGMTHGGSTPRSTTVVAALEGAACMNNTFCLAIFMALVYFKSLAWKFSAETLAILIVEGLVACIAMCATQKVYHALLALALFPLSLVFVATLEANGFD